MATSAKYMRVTAIASIALVVTGLVLGVVGHDQIKHEYANGSSIDVARVGGLVYTVAGSREFDPRNPVDRQILRGIPAARRPLPRSQAWFGVFVDAFNPQR